jgi:hypothetical protein
MEEVREYRIAAPGEIMIDWVCGGASYTLDGATTSATVHYAYQFDAAVASPTQEYAVIYTRFGTKGLVLKKGKVLREINRSFYHANVYEYPVAIIKPRFGRGILAHCPRSYNQLEFEDLETGRVLTGIEHREPSDFLHSRLLVSPDGRFLVSAGWLWHPIDEVRAFDIKLALKDPSHLDGNGIPLDAIADESAAAFSPDGRLIVALNKLMRDENLFETGAPISSEIRSYDLKNPDKPMVLRYGAPIGTIFAVGNKTVLSVFDHPRLLDLATGTVLREWTALKTGNQTTSIVMSGVSPPPMAIDARGRRFAIADPEGITVLEFHQ